MKKRSLIACVILGIGSVAGLVVLLVGGVFALTRPVVDASEQFLALVAQGKIADAYASTADNFRSQQDEASFAEGVGQLGLDEFASVSWHSRQIENQTGTADGTVATKTGGTRSVSVRLVREGGRWAVDGVRYGGVELATIKASPRVPPEEEIERIVAEALLDFNRAIRSRDFTAFHAKLSDVWKHQTTPERLQKTFQEFVDKDVDIAGIELARPWVAPPPALNGKGVLVVVGHYPTRPYQVRFELEFTHERAGWKLVGFMVGLGKAAATD